MLSIECDWKVCFMKKSMNSMLFVWVRVRGFSLVCAHEMLKCWGHRMVPVLPDVLT